MILVALLLLGAVTLVAVPVYMHYSSRESTDDAQIEGHITSISPRAGGTIEEVLVKDNQFVKAGDVLVRIDPSDYHVALTRSQADLADALANLQAARTNVPLTATNARSSLANAQAGVSEAQTAVEGARAQVAAAEARLNTREAALRETEAKQLRAEQDLARLRQLVEKDEISRREYDAAVAAAAAARASTDAARAAIAEAERGVNVARATVGQAQARVRQAQAGVQSAATVPQQVEVTQSRASSADARVQQAQASVKRAQLDLQYTIVRAPVNGIVSRRTAEVGQVVSPNQQLMVVVPLDDLWVVANFKETQLKEMRPGQRVEIEVDAFGGRKFYGRVDSIAGATGAKFSMLPPENATGNYVKVVQRVPVKIIFDRNQDPEHRLRPGMSVEPTVLLR
jgi:membrane fusion protein (multidrug efflux system)